MRPLVSRLMHTKVARVQHAVPRVPARDASGWRRGCRAAATTVAFIRGPSAARRLWTHRSPGHERRLVLPRVCALLASGAVARGPLTVASGVWLNPEASGCRDLGRIRVPCAASAGMCGRSGRHLGASAAATPLSLSAAPQLIDSQAARFMLIAQCIVDQEGLSQQLDNDVRPCAVPRAGSSSMPPRMQSAMVDFDASNDALTKRLVRKARQRIHSACSTSSAGSVVQHHSGAAGGRRLDC